MGNSNDAPWVTEARRSGTLDGPHYPQSGTHTWNAFAGLAIEMGGYGDLEAINPYNGERFWSPALQPRTLCRMCGHEDGQLHSTGHPFDGFQEQVSIYEALRRLVDAMEHHRFLDQPEETK